MPTPARIHPTAIISPEAVLADDVEIGPYVVIEGDVRIGEGTIVRPFAHLVGPMTIGQRNDIGTSTVIGERPQHMGYKGDLHRTLIGDGNVFREHVTIHRGFMGQTILGDRNYMMAGSHIGHDCVVGSDGMFANGCMLGGHCIVGDRVLLSGSTGVHQWSKVGRLSLVSGLAVVTKDIPPFLIMISRNTLAGVNVIGMRRAGMSTIQIQGVRKAYRILGRSGWTLKSSMDAIEQELGHIDVIQEMLTFIRSSKRGVCGSNRTEVRTEREAA